MVLEPAPLEVEARRIRFHDDFIEQYRLIVEAGVKSGEFKVADIRLAAACVFGGLTESLMSTLAVTASLQQKSEKRTPRADSSAHVDGVVDFCLRGLGVALPEHRGPATTRRRSARKRAAVSPKNY
jgi:hypothetical protein